LKENIVTNNTEIGLGDYGINVLEDNYCVFNGKNEDISGRIF
jgi:hypothetical protein